MPKTLYISDLDGTLLNKNAELSPYTKDALNRMIADGVHFSAATARTAASAFIILDGVQWTIPIVLLNGVLIYDTLQKRYVQVLSLSEKTTTAIISVLQELNTTGLMYQLKDNKQVTYYETLEHKPLGDFIKEREGRYNKVFNKVNFSEVLPENTIYFTLLDTYEKIQLAHAALSEVPGICLSSYKDIYSPDLWYLEIHNDKATKQSGTEYLRDAYGFEHIVGFGDNLNDLPMFSACDVKVAVENANPDVKTAADYICEANDNDGVAKWIEANM
jgi:Cof subfamily protein (haloacid dehalogenase superfamily)